MGAGASVGINAAVASASQEDLEATLASLPAEAKAKLAAVLSSRKGVFLCLGSLASPLPLPTGSADVEICGSGSYSIVMRNADGKLLLIGDGTGIPIDLQEVLSDCRHFASISVHDDSILGITKDDRCMAISPEMYGVWCDFIRFYGGRSEDIHGSHQRGVVEVELPLLSGRGLVQVASQDPESWLVGRDNDGRLWAFGPRAREFCGGSGEDDESPFACEVPLPSPCKSFSCVGEHGLALLMDGRVFLFGGGDAEYGKPAADGFPVRHITELDGKDVKRVAAARRHSAVLLNDGSVFTWGTCGLYEGKRYGETQGDGAYLGELCRSTPSNDNDEEYGPFPELACPNGGEASVVDLAASSCGNICYLLSDGRALRPALDGPKVSEELWRDARGLQIWGLRYTYVVAADIDRKLIDAAVKAKIDAALKVLAEGEDIMKSEALKAWSDVDYDGQEGWVKSHPDAKQDILAASQAFNERCVWHGLKLTSEDFPASALAQLANDQSLCDRFSGVRQAWQSAIEFEGLLCDDEDE